MTEKETIAMKREQIKILKMEIAELENKSIGSMVESGVLTPTGAYAWNGNQKCLVSHRAGSCDAWRLIIKTSMEVFRNRLESQNLRVSQENMTKSQKKKAALLCDEIIAIYNKYIMDEYANEYPLLKGEEEYANIYGGNGGEIKTR